MSRRKEDFIPINEGKAGIYVCGPTVYNYFHIGNARAFLVFDVLRRHLESRGFEVTYVQNLTDIDDKMIARAREEGVTVFELAERFIRAYFEDSRQLGIRKADICPRATDHMSEIVELINKLMRKGLAYSTGGDVYFDTQAYLPRYGRLSGQDLSELEAGARVEVDEIKRHPMDFALWKSAKPGEPFWDSPWGFGRPGWHIECSAMSMKYLGETFDIHCGGVDLIFPHHENEIAQSEGATGRTFARYWMHNGHINIDGEKMSKSANNFFMVRDIIKEFDPESVRMFLLSAHYRSPINFSRAMLEQAAASIDRLYTARDNWEFLLGSLSGKDTCASDLGGRAERALVTFGGALDDDLNTADALGVMFDFVREVNIALSGEQKPEKPAIQRALNVLKAMTGELGLLTKSSESVPPSVMDLADARQAAKKAKDFALADKIRADILEMGYIIEDTAQGPKVRIK
jgi:cysteinyl-tRNA synthetase